MVVETRDRRGTAAELIIRLGADMTVDDAVRTPFLLIGTVLLRDGARAVYGGVRTGHRAVRS
jgi:hypothetical protein